MPTPQEANYRPAEAEDMSCGTCANMGPDGMCSQLGIPVEPQMLCDLYAPMGAGGPPGGPDLMTKLFGGGPQ